MNINSSTSHLVYFKNRIFEIKDSVFLDPFSKMGERGGSVVECRTPEREVRGSKPTAAVLCP